MTSYYPLQPSRSTAPTFQPILDGKAYVCTVTFNFAAQRWYLNCYDAHVTGGPLVFSVAIVSTPPGNTLTNLTWDEATGLVTATTAKQHGYPTGAQVQLTVAGCAPVSYNGSFLCVAAGPSTLTYPLQTDPGGIVTPGTATVMVNLAAGYFHTSTLIYRNGNFEVSP